MRPPLPSWRDVPAFRLHEVEIRPSANEISTAAGVVRIKPRLMDLLLRLAHAPGEVVSRETLLDQVWSRRMVNDDVLSRAVADLRIALGDDAREARFIETLPKAGYRLIAPVSHQGVRPSAVAKGASPLPGATGVRAGAADEAPSPGGAAVAQADRVPGSTRHAFRRGWWVAAAAFALAAIAFVATRGRAPAPDQALLERQLAQAQPFSSEVANEVGPRFSPDGRRVAFAAGEGARSRIVVRDVAGGEPRVLGDPRELNLAPVFFPDGDRIAWFRHAPDGGCAIVAQPLAGAAPIELVDCAHKPQPRFDLTPDGRHLVYGATTRPQFPQGLVQRDLATGVERALTSPEPGMGDDLYPRVSPDGARVAFFRGNESHRQLWLVDLAHPGSARAAGPARGLSYGAAWLGATGPLLVAADWFGQRALNLLVPETGMATFVGGRGARFPDADAAGNIVFEQATYTANLFVIRTDDASTAPAEWWPSTRYSSQPEFAPDGGRVVFVSNRDGPSGLYVGTPGGTAMRLALPDGYIYMRPHWSADGKSIHAVRVDRRAGAPTVQQGLRILYPSGAVEVLTALGNEVVDVRDTDGGRALIVGETTGSAVRVLRAPRDDLAARERLPLPLVSEYQVAGNRIAFMQPQLTGVTLCELATLKCEPLAVPLGEANRFDWVLTADALWYRAGSTPDEVRRFDLPRREVTWRGAFVPTGMGLSLAPDPDGRALLVVRESPPILDLMIAPRLR